MNSRATFLAAIVCLLAASLATAQEKPGSRDPKESQKETMYEDIEIFRQLLSGKLLSASTPVHGKTWFSATYCASCHTNPFETTEPYLLLDVTGTTLCPGCALGKRSSLNRLADFLGQQYRWPSATPIELEGSYLRGQGVVYTLTLPPPARDPRPETAKEEPKPVSDWDRIRQQLRKEKPDGAKPQQEPALSDVILKELAENGHRFSELGDNERITVAITFRDSLSGSPKSRPGSEGGPGGPRGPSPGGEGPGALGPGPPRGESPSPGPGPVGPPSSSSVEDYRLLGDLHLKQGKATEAIKAYEEALKLKPEPKVAAGLHRQIAQAYLTLQKDKEAREALEKAIDLLVENKGGSNKPAEPALSPLPAKLIISVDRKTLQQAGAGKMSFEEFKKAATVEYLTFTKTK